MTVFVRFAVNKARKNFAIFSVTQFFDSLKPDNKVGLFDKGKKNESTDFHNDLRRRSQRNFAQSCARA